MKTPCRYCREYPDMLIECQGADLETGCHLFLPVNPVVKFFIWLLRRK